MGCTAAGGTHGLAAVSLLLSTSMCLCTGNRGDGSSNAARLGASHPLPDLTGHRLHVPRCLAHQTPLPASVSCIAWLQRLRRRNGTLVERRIGRRRVAASGSGGTGCGALRRVAAASCELRRARRGKGMALEASPRHGVAGLRVTPERAPSRSRAWQSAQEQSAQRPLSNVRPVRLCRTARCGACARRGACVRSGEYRTLSVPSNAARPSPVTSEHRGGTESGSASERARHAVMPNLYLLSVLIYY